MNGHTHTRTHARTHAHTHTPYNIFNLLLYIELGHIGPGFCARLCGLVAKGKEILATIGSQPKNEAALPVGCMRYVQGLGQLRVFFVQIVFAPFSKTLPGLEARGNQLGT